MKFDPCVGSGFCCLQAQCMASIMKAGTQDRCPFLSWNGQRYLCDLMTGPEAERWRADLYEGAGCCSNLNAWRQDVRFRG